MTRQFPPECPEPPAAQEDKRTSRRFAITLITPLFGGGAIPKWNDKVSVVRGSSIRGHLRFWWRATRGRGFAGHAALHRRESQIWGSTASASLVRIAVNITSGGSALGPQGAAACPRYVTFPFEAADLENFLQGVAFELVLTFPPDLLPEVEAAVWAWTNFGGLGSRTRRGCGALFCRETAPANPAALTQWWHQMQERCAPFDGQTRGWPVLGPAALTGPASNNANSAWSALISNWQSFRQKPGFARNLGGQRPGRSRWPEADSLKAHTLAAAPQHRDSITLPDPAHNPGFPRAALGLPIVFDFRPNREELPNKGTLEPAESERMASPFLLRPWQMADGKVLPAVVPLFAPFPAALKYRFQNGPTWHIPGAEAAWFRPELSTYSGSPMAGLSPQGFAAEAFQNFLSQERQYRVVA